MRDIPSNQDPGTCLTRHGHPQPTRYAPEDAETMTDRGTSDHWSLNGALHADSAMNEVTRPDSRGDLESGESTVLRSGQGRE